ncbi:MAG: hypothetical protein J6U52_02945 [Alistipes sp.]|nr:hypothetical protein [Alistipes sp.]
MGEQARYMIVNGVVQEWQHFAMPYVYQHIHTLSYKARHTADHLKILNDAASRLFSLQCDLSRREVEQQIEQLLTVNHTTRNTSVAVTIKLYSSGDYTLEQGEASFYCGYVVRSLHPEATIIASSATLADYPTSAMVATRSLLEQIALARDLHRVIMASPSGEIIADAAEPLFIVKGYTLTFTPVPMPSLEQMLIERAAHSLRFKVEHAPITVQSLKEADEVLIASWQGITAIAHIDNKPYMSIIAERIATEMENKEKK